MAAGLKEVEGEPVLPCAKPEDMLLRRFLVEPGLPSGDTGHKGRGRDTLVKKLSDGRDSHGIQGHSGVCDTNTLYVSLWTCLLQRLKDRTLFCMCTV